MLGAGDRYTKRHPVPFGEYIPWRNVFGDSFGKLDMIPRDMLSGTRDEPLVVAGVPVADAICFDIAYDDGLYEQVTHGAEMAVVQTSNAMFIHTAQIEQQFEISRARAIEFGRPLAIASVNGISGVIDAEGHVLTQADPRTTAVLEADVSLDRSITPGTYVGHWVGRLDRPAHRSGPRRRGAGLSSARPQPPAGRRLRRPRARPRPDQESCVSVPDRLASAVS